jgi:hypothetical protein
MPDKKLSTSFEQSAAAMKIMKRRSVPADHAYIERLFAAISTSFENTMGGKQCPASKKFAILRVKR